GRRRALETKRAALQDYLGLRETAKHYLMMGYAQIRRVLLEWDRRYRLRGGVFYLLPDELPLLADGEDLTSRIVARRRGRAAGLVMETGGVLSHGAIVAREFGLPAVAGISDAVRRLRTGQRVRVDGGRGTVDVLSEG